MGIDISVFEKPESGVTRLMHRRWCDFFDSIKHPPLACYMKRDTKAWDRYFLEQAEAGGLPHKKGQYLSKGPRLPEYPDFAVAEPWFEFLKLRRSSRPLNSEEVQSVKRGKWIEAMGWAVFWEAQALNGARVLRDN